MERVIGKYGGLMRMEQGRAARTDRSVLGVCDCSRAFVLTLYHAKQRGLDKADTLFVIGKK